MTLSSSQIDRLGDRLRESEIQTADLELLHQYRRSFATAYSDVLGLLRHNLALKPTGREKTNFSIIEKLARESVRLSQIQDIAGCRVVVSDAAEQNQVVKRVVEAFGKQRTSVIDRREKPSHGYRAVHVLVRSGDRTVEIQIRTSTQDLWAAMCEKLSDILDPSIKYGGGPDAVRAVLRVTSKLVSTVDQAEMAHAQLEEREIDGLNEDELRDHDRGIDHSEAELDELRANFHEILRNLEQIVIEVHQRKHGHS